MKGVCPVCRNAVDLYADGTCADHDRLGRRLPLLRRGCAGARFVPSSVLTDQVYE